MTPRITVQGVGDEAILFGVERWVFANCRGFDPSEASLRSKSRIERRRKHVRDIAALGLEWWRTDPEPVQLAREATAAGLAPEMSERRVQWLVESALADPRFTGVGLVRIIIFLLRRPEIRLILTLLFEYLLLGGGTGAEPIGSRRG